VAYPAPSTFSLAASRLGWPLESVACIALHAAPFERLRPHLAHGARIICLVRDGGAAVAIAQWLATTGWGASRLWTLVALGGPRERISIGRAEDYVAEAAEPLVALAIEAAGSTGLSRASGLADDLFAHDGQITKRPMRALALSALSPRAGETLWDIGAGSGSISVEWALAGGRAIAVEARADRAANIRANASAFGLAHRISVVEGRAPAALHELERPDAAFIGGGLDAAMFDELWALLAPATRFVAHAVTLESEALLQQLHCRHGGELMRIDIAHAAPLGRYRSWQAVRPVVQWSTVKRSGAGA
jgi:precorrin-6Y C5,15-methyltransferase (decarboxylating)